MSQKISITLDASNRSRFINDVLLEEKKRIFLKELAAAYQEQANTPEFQEEIAVWDVTVDDESVLSKEQQKILPFNSPNLIIKPITDLDPWTQSLIGVIQLNAEEPTESYVNYLEKKYR